MFTVVLIIQIMITVALVVVVLLQRSEGGALGIGGGGGGGGLGGLMTGRGAANLLTRTTAILAACFFATSIVLTIIARNQADEGIQFDSEIIGENGGSEPAVVNVQDLLSTTGETSESGDAAPAVDDEEADIPSPPADAATEDGPVIPDDEG